LPVAGHAAWAAAGAPSATAASAATTSAATGMAPVRTRAQPSRTAIARSGDRGSDAEVI